MRDVRIKISKARRPEVEGRAKEREKEGEREEEKEKRRDKCARDSTVADSIAVFVTELNGRTGRRETRWKDGVDYSLNAYLGAVAACPGRSPSLSSSLPRFPHRFVRAFLSHPGFPGRTVAHLPRFSSPPGEGRFERELTRESKDCSNYRGSGMGKREDKRKIDR